MPGPTARSSPARAPAPLAEIQDLVNTLDVERGTDELADPASAEAWLAGTGHELSDPLGEDDLGRLRAFRRALRDLITSSTPEQAGSRRADAARRVAEAVTTTTYSPEIADDASVRFRPGDGGMGGLLGALMVAMHDAQHDGTWPRLKICRNDRCAWAFYDQSRNHSGTWCAMGICGNRDKVARHRRRRRQSP